MGAILSFFRFLAVTGMLHARDARADAKIWYSQGYKPGGPTKSMIAVLSPENPF